MKKLRICLPVLLAALFTGCSSGTMLKLGDAPLTITVQTENPDFDGAASVYINSRYVGTTESRRKSLSISLSKGEYTIVVTAPGFQPWRNRITLLGGGYKQTAVARLQKIEDPDPQGG